MWAISNSTNKSEVMFGLKATMRWKHYGTISLQYSMVDMLPYYGLSESPTNKLGSISPNKLTNQLTSINQSTKIS